MARSQDRGPARRGRGKSAAAAALGARIRALRRAQELTLEVVARGAGITRSYLSQIEKGVANPSLQTLRNLARTLNVSLFDFLGEDENQRVVVRKAQRKRMRTMKSGVEYELLSPDLRRSLEVIMMELRPGQWSVPTPMSHPGEECATVLRGKARVQLGDEYYDLDTGDTIYFRSDTPHRVLNTGDDTMEMISAITPPSF